LIYLDMYDEESKCYTPCNFLDFCGFECRYNDITGMYDVNGFVNGAVNIASFDDEEFAIAVTRSLYAFKAAAEIEPQPEARPEARFINIDMIVEKLEKMEDEEEEYVENETTKERTNDVIIDHNYFYIACICVGFMIGLIFACVVLQ